MTTILELMKNEANKTYTENGAVTYASTMSDNLDLFATIGALRCASDAEIIKRFSRAYAENADLAMKTLFFARDIRGGLGERRVFRVIFNWLAENESASVKKNIEAVGEYGRFDDLMVLLGTKCEAEAIAFIKGQLEKDMASLAEGGDVSLLAKWMPSVNATNADTVKMAKRLAFKLHMSNAAYRKMLSALRAQIKIIENNLREKDYTFDYEKQASKALFKYRKAFIRNDGERYFDFMGRAVAGEVSINTSTLYPYDIIAPIINGRYGFSRLSADEIKAIDATWNAQDNFAGCENALVVVDGSGSMYDCGNPSPAAVAQSLAIYFAERNEGAFKNHFITFSEHPRLVEIKGADIAEKVRYCMGYNEVANTNLMATFKLLLDTAVKNNLKQSDMPSKLYIISDMEFDYCVSGGDMTNFEYAKQMFAEAGYKLPTVVFWNVQSRNTGQPVKKNEQGVALVSGASPQIFAMLKDDILDPYGYMLKVLLDARYEGIVA